MREHPASTLATGAFVAVFGIFWLGLMFVGVNQGRWDVTWWDDSDNWVLYEPTDDTTTVPPGVLADPWPPEERSRFAAACEQLQAHTDDPEGLCGCVTDELSSQVSWETAQRWGVRLDAGLPAPFADAAYRDALESCS